MTAEVLLLAIPLATAAMGAALAWYLAGRRVRAAVAPQIHRARGQALATESLSREIGDLRKHLDALVGGLRESLQEIRTEAERLSSLRDQIHERLELTANETHQRFETLASRLTDEVSQATATLREAAASGSGAGTSAVREEIELLLGHLDRVRLSLEVGAAQAELPELLPWEGR